MDCWYYVRYFSIITTFITLLVLSISLFTVVSNSAVYDCYQFHIFLSFIVYYLYHPYHIRYS